MYICLTEKSSKSRIKLTGHRSDHENLFLVAFTLLVIRYLMLLVNILSLVQTNSSASASSLRWIRKRRRAGSELVTALKEKKGEHTINTLTTDTFRFYDENEIFSILNSAPAWTSVILAGKIDSHRHSTACFSEKRPSGGNELSDVRSFIILWSVEG